MRWVRLPDARPQLDDCPGPGADFPVDFDCAEADADEKETTEVSPVWLAESWARMGESARVGWYANFRDFPVRSDDDDAVRSKAVGR